jgi:hypothetical protein
MKSKFASFALLLIACVAAIIAIILRPTPEAPIFPQGPTLPPEIVPKQSKAELRAERDLFFASDVEPNIKEADRLNREAARRCVARLKDSFNGYRAGINPFCKEINTWGTRLGVIRRMPGDWWYEKSDVGNYIQAKFATHLFTDEKLKEDIGSALEQFRVDVEANQNNLVTSIRAAISSTDLPGLPEIDYAEFAKELSSRLTGYCTESAKDSVVNGIVIEVASGVGGYAAEQLLAQLVVRLTAMVGASTASAGGATAGAAAVGGGGGSFGGPLGTAAGIAVGVVIGGAIDWWMSSSFEATMTEQLNGLINELNKEVIAGNDNRPGLQDGLRGSCDVICKAYQDSFRAKIVDGGVL